MAEEETPLCQNSCHAVYKAKIFFYSSRVYEILTLPKIELLSHNLTNGNSNLSATCFYSFVSAPSQTSEDIQVA